MKLLLLIALFSSLSLNAQLKFGAKAGFLVSNNTVEYINVNEALEIINEAKAGALIGVVADWQLSQSLSLRSGLELVIKGSKERQRENSFYSNYGFTIGQPLTYLDVPINLVYAIKCSSGKFIIGAGPVAGFYLHNNYTNYRFKDVDLGVNIVAGYEWPVGFFVNINHTRGLKNISLDKDFFSDYKNLYYGLSVGYMF